MCVKLLVVVGDGVIW